MAVFQRSEAQKQALTQKLYTLVFLALLLGTVVYFGPGLEPELQPVEPQGQPHPRLPEALLRLGQYWEGEKERIHYVHLYTVIDRCFPDADPDLRERAKKGLLRAQTRSL